MNIGIVTAGGVCPGVNSLIHTLTLFENSQGNHIYGFTEGFRGINNNNRVALSPKKTEEGAGSILRVSCDQVELEKAKSSIMDLDRLYCICGNESMKSAKKIALFDDIKANVVGIPKTIFNDIPGMESVGFQTAVQEFAKYIDYAHTEAATTNSIVFLEAPGNTETGLATNATYARFSKVTDVINKKTINTISARQIKNNYEVNGYAVVVVGETSEYKDILEFLKDDTKAHVKIMNPGFVLRDAEPCVYDTILSVRIAREAFEYAQKYRNFIKGAGTAITFENYVDVV
jgi:6-phosphofructokinase